MSAAARLRRLDENVEIIVVERSGNVSFANCGLPYYVGGVIEDRSALLLQTPESLAARFGIDVRVNTEAIDIDPQRKTVCVRSLADGTETELPYDKIILSPGARPVLPPIPGIERVLPLRDIEDTDQMVAAVADAQTAVVIGAGFIGVEVAENLLHRGLRVALIEAADQILAPLDPEMVEPVHDVLRSAGIDLHLGAAVSDVGAHDVTLADGTTLPADVVVASIGVRPDSGLAQAAGLTLGERGGIVVDEFHRTNHPDIYAVGDAVEKTDAVTGEPAMIPLANTANLQGRRVADHIAGLSGAGRPTLGTAIVGILGLQVASTGWNEKRLQAAGRPYLAIHTHPASHATYYPGAETLALKLLVDPQSDEILGAQGVGREGIDTRLDVIATAMRGGLKASDLAELELTYAPQFSSAKDPVNMLGFVAENHRTGMSHSVQWHEVEDAVAAGATLLDVRSVEEFADGAIPGALNIPVDDLRARLHELLAGEVVIYCAVGIRGHIAGRLLAAHGVSSRNLSGGYATWTAGMAKVLQPS